MKELVQQQRETLYSTGHRHLHMSVPVEVVEQLDELKRRYGLRSRDAVVGRIIRKGAQSIRPDAFVQRPCDPGTAVRRISPIVAGELAAYVKAVQRRFRGLAYGPVFEMILAEVGPDLSPRVDAIR